MDGIFTGGGLRLSLRTQHTLTRFTILILLKRGVSRRTIAGSREATSVGALMDEHAAVDIDGRTGDKGG